MDPDWQQSITYSADVFLCRLLSLQPRRQLRGHDQQMAVGVGEDLLQLDLHRPLCVDAGGPAGPGQQRL